MANTREMISSNQLFFSLLGGIIPAVVWLLFWLREDARRPEPRGLLILTFVCGMIAVPLVIPFQKWTMFPDNQLLTFFLWATLEEGFKFIAALGAVLWRKEDDEPLDPLIYMMTVALGFAAVENTLFILQPLLSNNITESLLTGNIRFVGASLLHTISSATIGIAMGLSFYKAKATKWASLLAGFILAVVLHTTFNFFIIRQAPSITIATLGFVWIAIVILMLFFERIKKVYPVNPI